MKKLRFWFSAVPVGLSWLLSLFVAAVPLIFLPGGFILKAVFAGIMLLFEPSTLLFWTWALVRAIMGPQDVWAIVYYVLYALLAVPSILNLISLFSRK